MDRKSSVKKYVNTSNYSSLNEESSWGVGDSAMSFISDVHIANSSCLLSIIQKYAVFSRSSFEHLGTEWTVDFRGDHSASAIIFCIILSPFSNSRRVEFQFALIQRIFLVSVELSAALNFRKTIRSSGGIVGWRVLVIKISVLHLKLIESCCFFHIHWTIWYHALWSTSIKYRMLEFYVVWVSIDYGKGQVHYLWKGWGSTTWNSLFLLIKTG